MLLTNLKTSNKNWNIFDAITLLRVDESKGHTYTKILLSCSDTKHVENLIYIPPLPKCRGNSIGSPFYYIYTFIGNDFLMWS